MPKSLAQVGNVAAAEVPPVNGAATSAAAVGINAPPISYFREPSLD